MSVRIVILSLTMASLAHAAPAGVSVFESRDRAATTEGDTVLATDPATAYAAVLDVANWSRFFPDLRRAVVDKRTRDALEVRFVRRDGSVDHLRFHNQPEARMIAFEQIGGDADVSAELVFSAGATAGTTRVHSRLHADVHGLASAFVSNAELRARRQQQVRASLGLLQAYFAGSVSAR